MSSWYVFTTIGLYPLDPVSGTYLLMSPVFDFIKIKLSGHEIFEIVCHKKDAGGQYIKEIKCNGKTYKGIVPDITWERKVVENKDRSSSFGIANLLGSKYYPPLAKTKRHQQSVE